MTWSAQQLANLRAALTVVDIRGLDETTAQQVITGILTECSALNYSNPLYPNTIPLGDGLPPVALATSTKESCGVFQQRPHSPIWWGKQGLTLEQQAAEFMDVPTATGLFLDRLPDAAHRDNTRPWRDIQLVQGSEYDGTTLPYAANYQSNWGTAGALLNQLRGEHPQPSRTYLDGILMAKAVIVFFESPPGTINEADLLTGVYYHVDTMDTYKARRGVLDFYGIPYATEGIVDIPQKFGTKLINAVTTDTPIHSRMDGGDYPFGMFTSGADQKSGNNGLALTAIANQITAIAATLAAQDAATAEAK